MLDKHAGIQSRRTFSDRSLKNRFQISSFFAFAPVDFFHLNFTFPILIDRFISSQALSYSIFSLSLYRTDANTQCKLVLLTVLSHKALPPKCTRPSCLHTHTHTHMLTHAHPVSATCTRLQEHTHAHSLSPSH